VSQNETSKDVGRGVTAPGRIWLQPDGQAHDIGEWTWCWHEVGESEIPDVEYVRADLAAATLDQEVARWKHRYAVLEVARAEAEQAAAYWRNTAHALHGTP